MTIDYGSYGVYASTSQPSALHATNSPGSVRSVSSSLSESSSSRRSGTAGSAGGSGKRLEKGGEEYRRRRERNNIAVRKSREKAKQKSRDTELKVKTLEQKNMELQETINNLEGERYATPVSIIEGRRRRWRWCWEIWAFKDWKSGDRKAPVFLPQDHCGRLERAF